MISIQRIMLYAAGLDTVPSLENRLFSLNGDVIVDLGDKKYVNVSKDSLSSILGEPLINSSKNVYKAMSGQIISGVFPYNTGLREEFFAWLEKRGVNCDSMRLEKRVYDSKGYFSMANHFNRTKELVWSLLDR